MKSKRNISVDLSFQRKWTKKKRNKDEEQGPKWYSFQKVTCKNVKE